MKTKTKDNILLGMNLIGCLISFWTAIWLGLESIGGAFRPEIIVLFAYFGVFFGLIVLNIIFKKIKK